MAEINEDEFDGMPDPDHRTRIRVTGNLREEWLAEDDVPEVGDVIEVRRKARVVSVNEKEGASGTEFVVTLKLDEPKGTE
jgi:hypothetical protein